MLVNRTLFCVVIMTVFVVVQSGSPDKCSYATLGEQVGRRVPLSPRAYAAHQSEFIVEVTNDVCSPGSYKGAELAACDYDVAPYTYVLDKHKARIQANGDQSGQIHVYIVAFC